MKTGKTDPDEVPDPPAAPITKLGDIWLLGEHRVLCGDSTDPAAVAEVMAGELADLVWTDPPYGVDYVGKTERALTMQGDGLEGLEDLLAAMAAAIAEAARPGAAVYVAAPAGPAGLAFATALRRAGLWRQRLVWVKNVLVLGHSDYHYRHEDLYFGYVPGAEGRRGRGGEGWYGDNAQTSVLAFDRPTASREHPTAKPVDLVGLCLTNSSEVTDVVLDLFGGSGSTLMAAETTGRRAMLMEIDPAYVDVICRRFEQHTGITPVLASSGEAVTFDA